MKKHKIQISEPWDFAGPDGSNVIEVTGVGIIVGPNKPNWATKYYLVNVDVPFRIKNALTKQLICSPRYVGDTIEMVANGKCTVGIARVVEGTELDEQSVVEAELVDYCAIGSITTDT